jgi:hypothetical protein
MDGSMEVNYHQKKFRIVSNSHHGETSSQTVFTYFQDGPVVWGEYSGGEIIRGSLLAHADNKGCLSMTYQHMNSEGEFRTGSCFSTPEQLPDGRIRLYEKWQWTFGDMTEGESVAEELSDGD